MFKEQGYYDTGYKLTVLNGTILGDQGIYRLQGSEGIFIGSMKELFEHATIKLGFDFKEIETGLLEMENNFHDVAYYGFLKKFMFTGDTGEAHGQKKITH